MQRGKIFRKGSSWLAHSANQDMSDRYDKIRDDAAFRLQQAKTMGVGFKLPKQLKQEIAKSDKIVVRRVVRDSEAIPQE
jgi:hypothetical protein